MDPVVPLIVGVKFPEDFMFKLTKQEMKNWKSQIVISNKVKMGLRKCPLAFTEPGIAMLSLVLNSKSHSIRNFAELSADIMIYPFNMT